MTQIEQPLTEHQQNVGLALGIFCMLLDPDTTELRRQDAAKCLEGALKEGLVNEDLKAIVLSTPANHQWVETAKNFAKNQELVLDLLNELPSKRK